MRTELAEIAAKNGGPFTRGQAMQAGYTPMAIRERLRIGRWVAVRKGVYVDRELLRRCGACAPHGVEAAAAILALRAEHAAASHRSAAFLHGFDLLVKPDVVTLTRPPRGGSHADRPGLHVHRAQLPAHHVGRLYGIAVTSPARTIIDLARELSFREAVVAADSAARVAASVRVECEAVLRDCGNWPWINSAARVVAFIDPFAESALESLARVLFAEAGLPAPHTQVVVGDLWGPIGRVDFYWPGYGVVVEVDGMTKYRHEPYALVAEKQRQERLEQAGYIVRRLTWDDVMRFPDQGVRRVRDAFARGAYLPAHR